MADFVLKFEEEPCKPILFNEKIGSGNASHTHEAHEIRYAGGDEYISATDVDTALRNTSQKLAEHSDKIETKADMHHTHDAEVITYMASDKIQNVLAALDYLFEAESHIPRHAEDISYDRSADIQTVWEALEHLFDQIESASTGASDASEVTYDGSEQYIGGSTVEEALNNVSNFMLGFLGHMHSASEVTCGSYNHDISHVEEALAYLFGEVDHFSTALDELHTYAQALVNGGDVE